MKRNTVISICKAIAIILMVIGHADAPDIISRFLYEFHMPVFFITAGYFFSLRYLNDEYLREETHQGTIYTLSDMVGVLFDDS